MKNSRLNNFLSYLFAILLLVLVAFQKHPSLNLNASSPKKFENFSFLACCHYKEKNQDNFKNNSVKKTLDLFALTLNSEIHQLKEKKHLLKINTSKKSKEKKFNKKNQISKALIEEKLKPENSSKIKSKIKISAKSALAIDPKTNFVFYQKNPRLILPMASLTKLMTSLVAMKYFPLDLVLEVPEEINKIESANGRLKPKDRFYLKDLIHLMLIVSSNHAAYTIEKNLNIVPLMNLEAKKMGIKNTFFKDASGLNNKNVSSVKDISDLVYYILKEKPKIFEIEKIEESKIKSLKGNIYYLKNNNYFVNNPNFLGGKTGWLDIDFQNLVSIFKIKEKTIIIVVLGSKDRFKDTEKILKELLK